MKKFAVIVAGGSGSRMNSATPKQFLSLNNKPLLWYSVNAFLQAFSDLTVILVLPRDYITQVALIFNEEELKRIQVAEGGSTRFHSVKNGLNLVPDDAVVFVHDGVRCLVSEHLIRRCYEQAIEKGSAIPYIPATDSIRVLKEDEHAVADRNKIAIIQTPQTFLSNILKPAFETEYKDAFTDEACVAEHAGTTVYLIQGEFENIKVTRPVDMLIAAQILSSREK